MVLKDYLLLSIGKMNSDLLQISAMFMDLFGVKNPSGKWRRGEIGRFGYLDKDLKVEYAFHGAECLVEFSDGRIVSFDFGPDDNYTYDLYKFFFYLETLREDNFKFNEYDMKRCLSELESEGKIMIDKDGIKLATDN